MLGLSELARDCLLDIIDLLGVQDTISLLSTCRHLRQRWDDEDIWARHLRRQIKDKTLIDLSLEACMSTCTVEELRSLVLRPYRFELAMETGQIAREKFFALSREEGHDARPDEAALRYLDAELVTGGRYLITVSTPGPENVLVSPGIQIDAWQIIENTDRMRRVGSLRLAECVYGWAIHLEPEQSNPRRVNILVHTRYISGFPDDWGLDGMSALHVLTFDPTCSNTLLAIASTGLERPYHGTRLQGDYIGASYIHESWRKRGNSFNIIWNWKANTWICFEVANWIKQVRPESSFLELTGDLVAVVLHERSELQIMALAAESFKRGQVDYLQPVKLKVVKTHHTRSAWAHFPHRFSRAGGSRHLIVIHKDLSIVAIAPERDSAVSNQKLSLGAIPPSMIKQGAGGPRDIFFDWSVSGRLIISTRYDERLWLFSPSGTAACHLTNRSPGSDNEIPFLCPTSGVIGCLTRMGQVYLRPGH